MKKRKCYGTDQYHPNYNGCKSCPLYTPCGNIENKKSSISKRVLKRRQNIIKERLHPKPRLVKKGFYTPPVYIQVEERENDDKENQEPLRDNQSQRQTIRKFQDED